ncbi:uncharacterized protein AMSG_05758 [Thecamonas trahens ATCC 50062]|uniref:Uncharacterized protein n=1 Tax=Thecamonas trahens ATCC 50062 TaxID=461836 RepID=A0A0L0DD14_THETB|nr:hypothetical protein AMSG_05758 [Thecamonas trahens ATCC 50062]KNC50001.1 hypothetical protein AMSG_05758 [Thecamonas trahens ATCC 50062]|eukprot:XP_013757170.1 hypothetical protein AMSG_05758 [Thecamonas trahens ATCC 50062]
MPTKAVSNLVDYAEEFPKKLSPISQALRKRAVKDLATSRTPWVVLAASVLEVLVAELPQHLALFAADVVAVIEMMLESNVYELQSKGAAVFVTYASHLDAELYSRHKWTTFVEYFSAMCWKQLATGSPLVRPGLLGLRAVISQSAILDTELVDVLSSIVPAIVSNMSRNDSTLPDELLAAHPFVSGAVRRRRSGGGRGGRRRSGRAGGGGGRRGKRRRRRRQASKRDDDSMVSVDKPSSSSSWSSATASRDAAGSGTTSRSDAAGSDASASDVSLDDVALSAVGVDLSRERIDELTEAELAGLALYEMGAHANSSTLRTIIRTLLDYFTTGEMWTESGVFIGKVMRILMAAVGVSYRYVPVQSALEYLPAVPHTATKARIVDLACSLLATSRVPLDTSTALQVLNQLVATLAGARGELRKAIVNGVLTLAQALPTSSERLELLLFLGSKLSFCAADEAAVPLLDAATAVASTLAAIAPAKIAFLEPLLDALTVAASAPSTANRVRVHKVYAHLFSVAAENQGFEAKYGSQVRYAMYFLITQRRIVVHPCDLAAMAETLAVLLRTALVDEVAQTVPMLFKLQEKASTLPPPLASSVHTFIGGYLRALGERVQSAELVDHVDRVAAARSTAGLICPYVALDADAGDAARLYLATETSKYPAHVVTVLEDFLAAAGGGSGSDSEASPRGSEGRRSRRKRKSRRARAAARAIDPIVPPLFEKEVVVSCLLSADVIRDADINVEQVLDSGWSSAQIAKEHQTILARRKHKQHLFHKLAAMAGMFTSLHKAAKEAGLDSAARRNDLAASDVELFADMFRDGASLAAPPDARSASMPVSVALHQSHDAMAASCAATRGARLDRAAILLGDVETAASDALVGQSTAALALGGSSELDESESEAGTTVLATTSRGGYGMAFPSLSRYSAFSGPPAHGPDGQGSGGMAGVLAVRRTPALPAGVTLVQNDSSLTPMQNMSATFDFTTWAARTSGGPLKFAE